MLFFLIVPSPIISLPITNFVSCICVFLSFSFIFFRGYSPSSLGSFGHLFGDLLLFAASLVGKKYDFPVPQYFHCCVGITFVKSHFILDCGFYCIFFTYFFVSCLVGFFTVEAEVSPQLCILPSHRGFAQSLLPLQYFLG